MTKAESPFAGVPGIKSINTILQEQMQPIREKIKSADSFMQHTIFPALIVEFADKANAQINLDYDFYHWGDINSYSTVITAFWDIKLLASQDEDGRKKEEYSAKAIAIEMTPEGVAILRGEDSEEHPSITLTVSEWKNNKRAQESAFVDTFIHPKIVTIENSFEDPFEELSAGYEVHD